jgi:hypothetical protein
MTNDRYPLSFIYSYLDQYAQFFRKRYFMSFGLRSLIFDSFFPTRRLNLISSNDGLQRQRSLPPTPSGSKGIP